MLHGRLLDKNTHSGEPLADVSYPVVPLQGRESRCDRFIERLSSDLYRVLNVLNVLHRNCARSENHTPERSIFALCSPASVVHKSAFVKALTRPLQLPCWFAVAQYPSKTLRVNGVAFFQR